MTAVPAIDRTEIERKLDAKEGVAIVEALGPMYYDDAHLPGALNLPDDRVDELAPEVLPDKDAFVVVYCSNAACQNSAVTSRRLVELGYTNVHEYVEGKEDWIGAGLPVERTAAA